MKLPIRIGEEYRNADIEYVSDPKSEEFVVKWRKNLGRDKDPVRRDAVDFANLACKRFRAHHATEIYAKKIEDIDVHKKDNPNSEVANLVIMRCDWFEESSVIGVAHFRRSWCNNLILDYLAAHPWVASKPESYPRRISGVGIGLLYFISGIGARLNSKYIWGEATQNSSDAYQKFFDLKHVKDLIFVPKKKFVAFSNGIENKWRSHGLLK